MSSLLSTDDRTLTDMALSTLVRPPSVSLVSRLMLELLRLVSRQLNPPGLASSGPAPALLRLTMLALSLAHSDST